MSINNLALDFILGFGKHVSRSIISLITFGAWLVTPAQKI